jgi:hypothetical protein
MYNQQLQARNMTHLTAEMSTKLRLLFYARMFDGLIVSYEQFHFLYQNTWQNEHNQVRICRIYFSIGLQNKLNEIKYVFENLVDFRINLTKYQEIARQRLLIPSASLGTVTFPIGLSVVTVCCIIYVYC